MVINTIYLLFFVLYNFWWIKYIDYFVRILGHDIIVWYILLSQFCAFYIYFDKFLKRHLLRHSSRFSSLKSLIFSWLFSESSMCGKQCLINVHQMKNLSSWYNVNGRLGFSRRNCLRYFTTRQTYNSSLPKRHVRLGHEADRKFSFREEQVALSNKIASIFLIVFSNIIMVQFIQLFNQYLILKIHK